MAGETKTLGDLLNPVDRLLAWLNPELGIKRMGMRNALKHLQGVNAAPNRAHEAAGPSRLRNSYADRLGPNAIVQQGARALRASARHAARNHDIARGILRTMVNNIVGAGGIGIEPQPRREDGTIHKEYAAELRHLWRDWQRRPEVMWRFTFPKCQRMMARAWLRDGEAFSQDLIGPIAGLDHGTAVPYSIELFESDFVPLEFNDMGNSIVQGVERNAWGRARAYWVYKGNPLESVTAAMTDRSTLKRVDASRVRHLAFLDHIGQSRGISEFASILARLDDIKDYEESERIAAKIAASLTAYVKKIPGQEGYDPAMAINKDEKGNLIGRDLRMTPGMIIDNLTVGEEIGLIDSNRPNPNVVTFRQGQLKAVAAGVGASYSSIAKSYDGTFSAQRQELVEQWVNYATLADDFTGEWVTPTWETFVSVADMSGVLPIPKDVKDGTADDALYTAQAMPWIDPYKEALGWVMLSRAGFASEIEVLRRRGVNPRDFLEQTDSWRKETEARGLVFTSNAANNVAVNPPTKGGEALGTQATGDGSGGQVDGAGAGGDA
jgi:lambda family phage portal protein